MTELEQSAAIEAQDREAIHPLVEEEIEEATERAMEDFWASVAESFPDAKSGDFDPMAELHFHTMCRAAVRAWVMWNVDRP